MLHAYHPLKALLVSALLATSFAGVAQTATPSSPEAPEYTEGKVLGESLVKDIMSSYEAAPKQEAIATANAVKNRFDAIADTALSADRDKVLEFLGIDPSGPQTLFYFVSFSMPLEVLRSYTLEAMWAGGTLVFRGVPPGKTVHEFLTEDVSKLAYGKGAAAHVSIDPRLYDAYKITTVPSIVVSKVMTRVQCAGIEPVQFKVGKLDASYDKCSPFEEEDYWKVTGNVTSSYAFEVINEQSNGLALPYAQALAKGLATGTVSKKEQVPFAGKWEDIISPSDLLEAKNAREALENNLKQ